MNKANALGLFDLGRVRVVVTLTIAAILFWLSIAISISGVLALADPGRALAWWPWSAAAASSMSEKLSSSEDARDHDKARALGRQALDRQALSPVAARVLALLSVVTDHDLSRATRLMAYSEALSRRDLATQLWFIEMNVQRHNVKDALIHYDRAMRASAPSRAELVPIIVSASNDPNIARQLAPLLSRRPAWRADFLDNLVLHSENAQGLAVLLAAAHFAPEDVAERGLLEQGLLRMVQLGQPLEAYRTYRRLGGMAAPGQLANANFAHDPELRPFDWWLNDNGAVTAIREIGQNGQWHVRTILPAGESGLLLRQLFLPAPGRYRLLVPINSANENAAGKVTLSIECLGGSTLYRQAIDSTKNVIGDFTVPSQNCQAAWIKFEGQGPFDGSGSEYLIEGIRLHKQ